MSHLNPSLLTAYNSLTDKHLTAYFNNARIRRHLQKVGLITRSGRIVPDKEYKHKLIQRAHQRHVRECLAQAIFHKVLDMERLHQNEIKRKLEEFARRERIYKLKAERSKRYEDEPVLMLSPRPPTGPKISHTLHSGPEGEHSESTESPSSSRPNTAPGKMQRPVRLKPLNSNSATASVKRSPRHRPRERDSSNDTDQPLNYTLDRDGGRQLTTTDFSNTVSPYRLPVINNYVTPVPPLTKKKERGPRVNGTVRGRKFRPTTAPTAATEPSTLLRTSAQSKVLVSMAYFGKNVHLSHDLMDLRDEVKVFQQHCGGENLCVYKGKLKEGEVFQFVSRRHQGFPFSLTLFLNGLQVDRLSSCCEFKHRKGARLGGRHGHFGFCGVEGASPCYKCIIAMGLDKKPSPPQKRLKEEQLTSKSPDAKESTDEDTETQSNTEPEMPREMETEPLKNGETAGKKKTKEEYEEDFEADDEGPVEDGDEAEEKTMSAANEGEQETEIRDENDITEEKSISDCDDNNTSKVKRSSSVSSGRTSSLSSSDNDNSDNEIMEDTKEAVSVDVPDEGIHAEEDLTTAETKPEETTESSDVTLPQAATNDSETQDSPGVGIEKSDPEMTEDTDKQEGTEGEHFGDDAKPEDKPQEHEPERAMSMQEKLAEAILKESQCSSEPEFSDTSTEEDEGASVKTQQDGQGAEMESATSFTSPQTNTREDVPDKNEANIVHDDVESGQPTEERNQQEPHVPTEVEIQEIDDTQNGAASVDIEEKQTEEQSVMTDEVEQPDKRETEVVEDEETSAQESKEEKDSLVQEQDEAFVETPDTGITDAKVPEMEEEGLVSHAENDTETGAGDTESWRDTHDADQNIERRSDGQPDRDEREDQADEAGDDTSTREIVQETDGKVDDGEKASDETTEKEVAEEENKSEDLGIEDAEKPGDEEIQELESGPDSKAEDSTVKDEEGVKDEQQEREDEEQVINKNGDEAEEDIQEKPNSEVEIGGQMKTDENIEEEEKVVEVEIGTVDEIAESKNGNCVEKEEENEIEAEEMLVEEPEEEVADMKEISENTLEEGDREKEAVSGENIVEDNLDNQKEESVSHEVQDEVSGVPKDDTKEEASEPAGVNNDLIDSNIDEENGERQDANLEKTENVEEYLQVETQDKSEGETSGGEAQEAIDDHLEVVKDDKIHDDEKRDEEIQEIDETKDAAVSVGMEDKQTEEESEAEQPDKREGVQEIETEGGQDGMANAEINTESKEEETKDQGSDKQTEEESDAEQPDKREGVQEIETEGVQDGKANAEINTESKEEETKDQGSDTQKSDKEGDKEEADKESETSAKTFIENAAPQEIVNKDVESVIPSAEAEVIAEEPDESDLKDHDSELRTRHAPEGMDGGSSVSHSVKSQPVKKVKRGSVDSEDLVVHPEPLAKASGVDLVSNWINIHQESRYFQTFIEPLEEESLISEETEERLNAEVLDASDAPESTDIGGIDETVKSGDETATTVNEKAESIVESLKTETKVEAIEDAHSNHSKDSIRTSAKDEGVQEAGDTAGQGTSTLDDVINLGTTSTTEDIEDKPPSESKQPDAPTNDESQQSNQLQKTDVPTHTGQTDEASHKETSEGSEDNLKPEHVPQSPTITVITDLTIINKSEIGSQDDTASADFHSRQSDGSRNVDGNRGTKVIDGHFQQTLSRDSLSTFSLDDSRFFGPAGYPRLTTAHTENSY